MKRKLSPARVAALQTRKDARADRLIRLFADKMRKLGGGRVPEAWQARTAQALDGVPLNYFMKQFMSVADKPLRGRPRERSAEDNAHLVRTVESAKAELIAVKGQPVTDKEAIRHCLSESYESIPQRHLTNLVDYLAKCLSRARPPHLRRSKKKSQKSHQ